MKLNLQNDFTWAPIIPLIGGFPIGAEMALGKPPELIASYDGFLANDQIYAMHVARSNECKSLEYRNLFKDRTKQHIDIIVCTPPCAALSRLNTGKTEDVAGARCKKNEWMYQCLEDAIELFTANVVIIENAPNLYTDAGKKIRDNLNKICSDNSYSSTFYKTNTMYHGIPQNRDRTFFFAWKSKTAPLLTWYNRPNVGLEKFLTNNDPALTHQELITPCLLEKDGHYNFIKERYGDVRSILKEDKLYSCFKFIMYRGLFPIYLDWCRRKNVDRWLKLAEHRDLKTRDNKDAWDSSIRCYSDVFGAVVMRNITDALHPTEERSLTLREAMMLMGMPDDFFIHNGVAGLQKLTQSVPTCTAIDMVNEAMRFMRGEFHDSGLCVTMQNNQYKTHDIVAPSSSLDSFF